MRTSFLIRPHAWWYNKLPLSVLLAFLLIEGHPFSLSAILALAGVVCVVCCVANYGYALNELFDRDEDVRAGRNNAAIGRSKLDMWGIICASGAAALIAAALSGSRPAFILTAAVLVLPLTYSVPPLRTKERGWAGVFSDALAAHVFPAALAMVVFDHWLLPIPGFWVSAAILGWALATGLRGILSHQLHDDARDLGAGLVTVAHRHGHDGISRLVILLILPVEVLFVLAGVFLLPGHLALKIATVLFCVAEAGRLWLGWQPMYTFTRWWKGYIPFADEGLYKVWGPLALGLDIIAASPFYAPLPLLFVLLFSPRIRAEVAQLRRLRDDLRSRLGERSFSVHGDPSSLASTPDMETENSGMSSRAPIDHRLSASN